MGQLAFGLLLCFCPLALLAGAHRPIATFLATEGPPGAFSLEQNRFLAHDKQITTGLAVKGSMRQYWRDVELILKWPRSAPPVDAMPRQPRPTCIYRRNAQGSYFVPSTFPASFSDSQERLGALA